MARSKQEAKGVEGRSARPSPPAQSVPLSWAGQENERGGHISEFGSAEVRTVECADYLEAVQENPWTFPAVNGCPDPPPEWVAAAWDTQVVQDCIAYDMAATLARTARYSVVKST